MRNSFNQVASMIESPLCIVFFLLMWAASSATAISVLPLAFQLAPNDGQAFSQFGVTLTASESSIWVGSPGDRFNRDPGSIYEFDFNGNQLGKIQPLDSTIGDSFGRGLTVVDGNIGVGLTWEEPAGLAELKDEGSVYLFYPNGTQRNKVLSIDASKSDNFGVAISAFEDKLLVGAPNEHPFPGSSQNGKNGAAYILDNSGNNIVKLQAEQDFNGSWFGAAVALSNDVAVVSAYAPIGDLITPEKLGKVYVFDYNGTEILQLDSDHTASDLYGLSLATHGEICAVGSPRHVAALKSGAAYIFSIRTGQELAKLVPGDGAIDDEFGYSVAVSELYIAVGAPIHDVGGAVYIYNTSDFQFLGKVMKSSPEASDTFGRAVLITSTNVLLVGDPTSENFRTGAPTSGMVFGYNLNDLGSISTPTASTTAPALSPGVTSAPTAALFDTAEIVGIVIGVIGLLLALPTVLVLFTKKKKGTGGSANILDAT